MLGNARKVRVPFSVPEVAPNDGALCSGLLFDIGRMQPGVTPSPASISAELLWRQDRLQFFDNRRRLRHDIFHNGLQVFAWRWVQLVLSLLDLRQKSRVFHGLYESVSQNFQTLRRHPGRSQHWAAESTADEHHSS